jgi:hypothetical protein
MIDRWREFRRSADLRTKILADIGAFIEARAFHAGGYRERTPLMAEIRREGTDFWKPEPSAISLKHAKPAGLRPTTPGMGRYRSRWHFYRIHDMFSAHRQTGGRPVLIHEIKICAQRFLRPPGFPAGSLPDPLAGNMFSLPTRSEKMVQCLDPARNFRPKRGDFGPKTKNFPAIGAWQGSFGGNAPTLHPPPHAGEGTGDAGGPSEDATLRSRSSGRSCGGLR